MSKTILLTGATDGIGLKAASILASKGHNLILHGRNAEKLKKVVATLASIPSAGDLKHFVADFANLYEVANLVEAIRAQITELDAIINNAGVFRTPHPITEKGLDVRFVVNTIAPYVITKGLLPLLHGTGRVINVSSAAQAPVNLEALSGRIKIQDAFNAYAQSKLALNMWSRHLAMDDAQGPVIVAVNPGSMLGTKMVREGFGVDGGDVLIGADILTRAALDGEFEKASGAYYDNDSGQFADPHPDGLNPKKTEEVVNAIETLLQDQIAR